MTQLHQEMKMHPWQVFNAARRALGAEKVARIFNRSVRAAHDWAQDPVYTHVRCRSPLECLHTLFSRMADVGRGYAAREAIRYLQGAIDPDVVATPIIEPRPNIAEAILANYSAVADLHRGIEAGDDIEEINRLKRAAMDDIERTVASYISLHPDSPGQRKWAGGGYAHA